MVNAMGLKIDDLNYMDFAEIHDYMCDWTVYHDPDNKKNPVRIATQADIDRL